MRPTPLHPRTSALCRSLRYKDWSGYHAVCFYGSCHEPEYFALRHAAGLLDVSPLFKYEVRGPQAAEFLSYVMARDVSRLGPGRVAYACWCDEDGKVLDDGTVTRLEEDRFRVTAATPSYAWLQDNAAGFDVRVEDAGESLAVLALQGPKARDVLRELAGDEIAALGFFRAAPARLGPVLGHVTRTGYTGDLGYELWVPPERACELWDAVMEAGRPHGLMPVGLDALDMARIEAGYVLLGVDYFGARDCLVDSRKASPYEIGLDWAVDLERAPFIGQAALREERRRGPARSFVGLEIPWAPLEALYARKGLPPQVPASAWRASVPLYRHGEQIGRASSGTWSPLLKKNIALGTLRSEWAAPGTEIEIEATVEFERRRAPAVVVERPFLRLERQREKARAGTP